MGGLAGGQYTVRASVSGYIYEYYDNHMSSNDADLIDVVTGELTAGINFELNQGGSISGTVRDTSGVPYTSGTVYLSRMDDPSYSAYSDGLDASGAYEEDPVWPGDYYVFCQLSGKPRVFYPYAFTLSDATPVTITDGGSLTGIDFSIPQEIPKANVSGRVSRDGVAVYCRVRMQGVDGFTSSSSDWTDSNTGIFEISNRDPGTYVFYAEIDNRPDYYYGGTEDESLATRVVLMPGADVSNIKVELPTAEPNYATVSGFVRDTLSRPIMGAQVSLDGPREDYDILSAPDGRFLFSQVLADSGYELTASRSGYFSDSIEDIDVSPGEELTGQNLTLTAYSGGSIAGLVVNASGHPLTDVSVDIDGQDVDYETYANADHYGEYFRDQLPPGTYDVSFSSSGYQSTEVEDVSIMAAQMTIQNVTLSYSSGNGIICGTVRDASGKPAYRVYVRTGSGTYRYDYTDTQGRYCLPGLSTSYDYRIYCPYEDGDPEVNDVMVVEDRITDGVDFVLEENYATISGTVRNATGEPVYDTEVRGSGSSPNPDTAYSSYTGNYIMGRVRTDGGREYRVYAEGAPYSLTYYNGTPLSASAELIVFDHGAGNRSGIDIDLLDGGSIAGIVFDDQIEPIVGCDIWLKQQDGNQNSETVQTDFAGRYIAQGLSPGTYKVRAKAAGLVTEYYNNRTTYAEAIEVSVNAGELANGIDFRLSEGGSISGQVVDTTGNPLASINVYVDSAENTDCSGEDKTNADGEYRVTGLFTDNYRVRAQASGYTTSYRYDVEVTNNENTGNIDFLLYRTDQNTPTPTPTITPTPSQTQPEGPTQTPTETTTPDPSGTPTETIQPTNTATPTQTGSPEPLSPADFNEDGNVEAGDMIEMISELQSGGVETDLNEDGVIDYKDCFRFSIHWQE